MSALRSTTEPSLETRTKLKQITIKDLDVIMDRYSLKIMVEVLRFYSPNQLKGALLRHSVANIITQGSNHFKSTVDWGLIMPSQIGMNTARALIKKLTKDVA